MGLIASNINQADRVNRIVVGHIIMAAACFNASQFFMLTLGLSMIIQGMIGWCGFPALLQKFKKAE